MSPDRKRIIFGSLAAISLATGAVAIGARLAESQSNTIPPISISPAKEADYRSTLPQKMKPITVFESQNAMK